LSDCFDGAFSEYGEETLRKGWVSRCGRAVELSVPWICDRLTNDIKLEALVITDIFIDEPHSRRLARGSVSQVYIDELQGLVER
jgi:hypothetical protein